MCRLILYIGQKPKNLYDVLISSKNSLWEQSINPKRKLMSKRDHLINIDGFGVGFLKDEFVVYKNPIPPYHDKNFIEISKYLKSNLILGHIRAVKCPRRNLVSYENCHPFKEEGFLMMHNGLIKDFMSKKHEIFKLIKDKYISKIKGHTDSEIIFYLFLSFLKSYQPKDIIKSFYQTINTLIKIYQSISANIVISNKNYSLVSRYINTQEEPPSLYYQNKGEEIKIASEPLDETEWKLLGKNKFLFINHQNLKISENDYYTCFKT